MEREAILVVEDNPQNLKLARIFLQLEGYEVLEARDADEAQQELKRRRPDLVLLDIQLPGRDGVDVLRSIRADPDLADLTVVAMTAYAMRGDQERFLGQGFDGYLSKPLDRRTFGRSVAAFIAGGRAEKHHHRS